MGLGITNLTMKKWVLRIRRSDIEIFEAIASGKKKFETRASTERYGKVSVGDCLIFSCYGEKLERVVEEVVHYPNIDIMFAKLPFRAIIPTANNVREAKAVYESFPGYTEKINTFGIVAYKLREKEH